MGKQVNIRLNSDEYELLSCIARGKGLKTATYIKMLLKEKIIPEQINLIFEKYKRGEISLNKAWRMTKLLPSISLEELKKRKIEPPIKKEIENYSHTLVTASK